MDFWQIIFIFGGLYYALWHLGKQVDACEKKLNELLWRVPFRKDLNE